MARFAGVSRDYESQFMRSDVAAGGGSPGGRLASASIGWPRMDRVPPQSAPPVVASLPRRLLRTGIAAYDSRFGGVELGSLTGLCAQEPADVSELCGRAAAALISGTVNIALADFDGGVTAALTRWGVPEVAGAVKRHAQAGVPIREIVDRTEEWRRYDGALHVLIVADVRDVASPLGHAVTELKILARRLDMAVIVGGLAPEPGHDGRLLGHFAELPEPSDVLVHLERRSLGPMFPPSFHLHVRKARPHALVSIPVRWDEDAGWVDLEAAGSADERPLEDA